jgi:hypothetical protein
MTDPDVTAGRSSGVPLKVAAGLAWFVGLGSGVPGVYAIWHFVRQDEVWTFLGNPTYGHDPSEFGFSATVPLLVAFLVVCAAEVVVGWMLWRDHPRAAAVSLVILPIEFVFWIGFVLPFAPLFGLARTALVLWVMFERTRQRRRGTDALSA